MSTRQIRLRVDGVEAVANPRRSALAWPRHSGRPYRWRRASVTPCGPGALSTTTRATVLSAKSKTWSTVCSIYPGFVVARPRGSEVMFAYGPAEYRWNIGTRLSHPHCPDHRQPRGLSRRAGPHA